MFKLPKAFLKIATKVQTSKQSFKRYMALNNDIMGIVTDIDSLKYNIDDKKIAVRIKTLEKTKKTLEKELVDLEESFYDVEKGLWLGVAWDLEDVDKEPFLYYIPFKSIHNHLDVFGTSGYGKSRLMMILIRQFIHYGWNIFCVDPKGGEFQEIAAWIYEFAAEVGMEKHVMRIMPSYPDISDKGNPLFGMTDVEIASLCSTLTVSGSGTESSDEQFFSGQVYRIVYAILSTITFLEKAISPDGLEIKRRVVEEVKNYIKFKETKGLGEAFIHNNLQFPDVATIALNEKQNKKVTTTISPYNRTLITFREIAHYAIFDHLKELEDALEGTPSPILEDKNLQRDIEHLRLSAKRALKEVTSIDKTFYEKTGTSLSVLLSQLAYGPVGEILCDVRINPLVQKARSKEGMIVLFQPAPMRFKKVSEILNKVYLMMWTSLFGTIGAGGRGMHTRVGYFMDEGITLMTPGIEEIFNKARQLGMTMVALFQSKSDVKYKLGETLADIVKDNTATSITMKQVSMSSRLEIAASFGTIKRTENVHMTEMDGGGRSTVVYSDVEILSADDINSLGVGEAFVQQGKDKFFVKFPYQKDPLPINITMPQLDTEKAYELIEKVESALLTEDKYIQNINIDMLEQKKG